MEPRVIFHRLVQRDMRDILRFYTEEASDLVADRFFSAFLSLVDRARLSPKVFHLIASELRRADIPGFPYHFVYREVPEGIRVLVLRHDKRHPQFGLMRK